MRSATVTDRHFIARRMAVDARIALMKWHRWAAVASAGKPRHVAVVSTVEAVHLASPCVAILSSRRPDAISWIVTESSGASQLPHRHRALADAIYQFVVVL